MHLRPLFVIFAMSVLAGCAPARRPPPPPPVSEAIPPAPDHCHVPPGGAPAELAERGIGGTGGATRPPPPPPGSMRPSLGVAGIIDGFGSVCLVGLEVGLLPGTTVAADGKPAAVGDLRVGQQALLAAAWTDGRPVTDHLLIRHAVIGPIDRTDGHGRMIVAGQTVLLAPAAWVDAPLRLGDWVAVSGLRTPADDILASRIDPAAGPDVLVHGRLGGTTAQPRIGGLPVKLLGGSVPIGSDVVLHGTENDGALQVTELRPDLLTDDPAALFGGQVHHFLIQTVTGSGARSAASFNPGVAPPPGGMAPPGGVIGGWAGPPGPATPSAKGIAARGPGTPGAPRR